MVKKSQLFFQAGLDRQRSFLLKTRSYQAVSGVFLSDCFWWKMLPFFLNNEDCKSSQPIFCNEMNAFLL